MYLSRFILAILQPTENILAATCALLYAGLSIYKATGIVSPVKEY